MQRCPKAGTDLSYYHLDKSEKGHNKAEVTLLSRVWFSKDFQVMEVLKVKKYLAKTQQDEVKK